MVNAIVSLSGGMDSATVLAKAHATGANIKTVGFYYGSKHNPIENKMAKELAAFYDVPFRLVDMSHAMKGLQSSLMADGPAVPEGHYEEENMRQTVVPGRNIIFCAMLAGIAMSEKASQIWLGIHAGDHYIYPDCRPDFLYAMRAAVREGTGLPITIEAPFLYDTKVEILKYGRAAGVPYELTRTCYTTDEVACGKCGSCQERLTAWEKIGVPDPLAYQTRVLLPKQG